MDNLKLAAIVTHVADARTCVLHPASHTHRQLTDEQLLEAGVDYTTLELAVESAKLVRRLRHRPMTQSQQLRDRFLADTESVKASSSTVLRSV